MKPDVPDGQASCGRSREPLSAVSRRGFLKGAGATVAGVGLLGPTAIAQEKPEAGGVPTLAAEPMQLKLRVNGVEREVRAMPSSTLLDTIRGELDLTGAKRICDRGSCGGCTMSVGGRVVNSCSFLAVDAIGQDVVTIEGLANGDKLTDVQQAFVDYDALQCGFCTPGMIVACTALLEQNPAPTRAEVAEGIAGNLCRCGTYPNVFRAVEAVVRKRKGG
ncbi:MAG: (2Fe-2S)-binding protein [Planctomycetota bacterium]